MKQKFFDILNKLNHFIINFADNARRSFSRVKEWALNNKKMAMIACAALVVVVGGIITVAAISGRNITTIAIAEDGTEKKLKVSKEIDFAVGSEDELIYDLQIKLGELGYLDDEPTNTYDENTEMAVIRFQQLDGTEQNGHVNIETWQRIFAEDAPTFVTCEGMKGEDIYGYQERLRELGYMNTDPTGYFGTDTKTAVEEFQTKNDLTSDGKIGDATIEKLYSEDVAAKFLSVGSKSDEVAACQTRLIKLGYLNGTADGSFGDATRSAVKLFQRKNGLTVDGYIGYQTKNTLMSSEAIPNVFTIGDEGSDVTRLQQRLVKLGYISKATGYYGSDTKKAVSNFQKLNGLSADGLAGAKTLQKLYSSDAKKATTKIVVGKTDKINEFIAVAKTKLGKKYVRGGKGPNVFDCSGFVYWCLKQVGVKQSYVTSVTWRKVGNYKTIKDIDDVRAGDIICYKPHHVGIAISSSQMIDASSAKGKIVIRSFKTSYWRRNFVCARRIFV